MGWFAGPLGVAGVSMLGAFTAGMQTWALGQLAIAICENGGQPLPPKQVSQVMNFARTEFRQDVWDKVKRNMPEDEDN